MRQSSVDPDDDHHLDGSTSSINDSDPEKTENESQHQQQQTKHGAWGHDITTIHSENVHFVFQNINGLTSLTGVHESLNARMVDLDGSVTALVETNVNWNNFKFQDDWEALLQQSYTSLYFACSSCDEGKQHQLQHGGTSMICNYRLGAKLLEKGSDTKLGRWSWMQFQGRHGKKVLVITAYQVS